MKPTVLRLRVYDPKANLVPDVKVSARLVQVGVSGADAGLINRRIMSKVTDANGYAEMRLWPTTHADIPVEYRIIARAPDGLKLFDVEIPLAESDEPVWLHDLLMSKWKLPQ